MRPKSRPRRRTPVPAAARTIATLAALLLPCAGAAQQDADRPATRPERTEYRETSRYADVVDFVRSLEGAYLHVTTYGYSVEGRALPLVVWGDVADATPESVLASGRTRVLIQAGIHGGEVEGKEAALVLLRELAAGRHPAWADSLVLLVAPLLDPDGNERINLYNRPRQNGPVGGVGERVNAQGLDLNRDHTKLESPEIRSLVRLYRRYDPHVVIDLHTTDGTFHAYRLTYAPPLNPDTDSAIVALLRERWLPAVQAALHDRYGWNTFYYGNLPPPDSHLDRGWYTFDARPRFNNNYVGLRNRFAILGEAYAYASFQERILVSLRFVEAAVDFAAANAGRIQDITREADARSLSDRSLATRSQLARSGETDILLGAVDTAANPLTGEPFLQRVDTVRSVRMPVYDSFAPAELSPVPRAYLVPPDLPALVDRLDAHGIRYSRLAKNTALAVDEFVVDSTAVADDAFQGHHERRILGHYRAVTRTIRAGTLVVSTDQPLGRLAFLLLEPRSDDGFLDWNFFDGRIERGAVYPVLRTAGPGR